MLYTKLLVGKPDDFLDLPGTYLMAFDAAFTALLRPSPVSVHDDSDVAGNRALSHFGQKGGFEFLLIGIPAFGHQSDFISDFLGEQETIASTGQTSTHFPQSMQRFEMTYGSPCLIAFSGQMLAQVPQPTQSSVIRYIFNSIFP